MTGVLVKQDTETNLTDGRWHVKMEVGVMHIEAKHQKPGTGKEGTFPTGVSRSIILTTRT
jgi:hypothetical protein